MVQVKHVAILLPLLIALAVPAAVTAAPPRHGGSTVGDHRSVTAFPIADGTLPVWRHRRGRKADCVSLNKDVGLVRPPRQYDHKRGSIQDTTGAG